MLTSRAAVFLLLLAAAPAFPATLSPFLPDSLQAIERDRAGRPFLLVLWSIDCPPCLREFQQLQRNRDRIPRSALVLVSIDAEIPPEEILRVVERFELTEFDAWVFAGPSSERLRYQIDPHWYGELPRAYLYDSAHRRRAHSGMLDDETLHGWLQTVVRQPHRGGPSGDD